MPMRVSVQVLMACAATALLSACPSTGVYRTADPVSPNEWRIGGAVGVGVLKDTERETNIPTAPFVLSARRGLREDLDLGLRLYGSGAQLSATWRVYHANWSLAVAPSIGGVRLPDSVATVDSINLFAGLQGIASTPLSKRWTIAMGPTTGWGLFYPETGGHAQGTWLGAFALLEATVGSKWRMGPELGGFAMVTGQVPVSGSVFQFTGNVKRDL
jgi:hypothetical protein